MKCCHSNYLSPTWSSFLHLPYQPPSPRSKRSTGPGGRIYSEHRHRYPRSPAMIISRVKHPAHTHGAAQAATFVVLSPVAVGGLVLPLSLLVVPVGADALDGVESHVDHTLHLRLHLLRVGDGVRQSLVHCRRRGERSVGVDGGRDGGLVIIATRPQLRLQARGE